MDYWWVPGGRALGRRHHITGSLMLGGRRREVPGTPTRGTHPYKLIRLMIGMNYIEHLASIPLDRKGI